MTKPNVDIALFDDDGITAIYGTSMHAKEVVRRVSDLDRANSESSGKR